MNKDDIVKNEILENAERLFQKWGYNKTTVEDIAKASGKGKSSLYYYYKDKEEIFTEVVNREASGVFAVIRERLKGCRTAEEKLMVYIETYISEIDKASNLYAILCREMSGDMKLLMKLANKFDAIQADYLGTILEEGLKSGEFSFPPDIDVKVAAYIIINTIGTIQLDQIFSGNSGKYPVGSVMGRFLLNGVRTRK